MLGRALQSAGQMVVIWVRASLRGWTSVPGGLKDGHTPSLPLTHALLRALWNTGFLKQEGWEKAAISSGLAAVINSNDVLLMTLQSGCPLANRKKISYQFHSPRIH